MGGAPRRLCSGVTVTCDCDVLLLSRGSIVLALVLCKQAGKQASKYMGSKARQGSVGVPV